MGFLGVSGKNWKNVGKWALRAAPIVAAPFTGGASLLAIGAGTGALSGALGGGGWKGAALGGGLGLIPGGGAAGSAAGGAVKAGLKSGLAQVGKKLGTQAALDVGTKLGGKYAGGAVGSALAGGVGSALTGGGFKGFGKGALQGVKENAVGSAVDAGSNVYNRYLPQGQGGGGGYGGQSLVAGGPQFGTDDPYGFRASTSQQPVQTSGGGTKGGNLPAGAGAPGSDIVGDTGGKQTAWEKWGPVAGQVGGAVVGGIAASKAQKAALKRSPEEQAALQGSQGAAGTLLGGGTSLLKESRPYISQPASYYQTLLHGNRAAMTQAVAPGMAQVTGVYRGAERDLDRTGVRGAQRDVASSELGREKASKLASMVTGVQPWAAGQLAELGTNVLSQANPMLGNAGNIYTNLLGQGLTNREQAARRGKEAGEAWGGLVRDIGEAIPGGKKNPKVKSKPGVQPAGTTTTTASGTPGTPQVPAAPGQIPNWTGPDNAPLPPGVARPDWNTTAWRNG